MLKWGIPTGVCPRSMSAVCALIFVAHDVCLYLGKLKSFDLALKARTTIQEKSLRPYALTNSAT